MNERKINGLLYMRGLKEKWQKAAEQRNDYKRALQLTMEIASIDTEIKRERQREWRKRRETKSDNLL